ncbi:MAG: tetratricopeptide repeat protein [Candidatus Anammoxibacter sp.]
MSKKQKDKKKQDAKKALKQKKRREKLKKITLAKQNTPESDIEGKVDDALTLLEEGEPKDGKWILEKLAQKNSNHGQVNYGLGVFAAFEGKYDKAISLFEIAIQISPGLVEAHYNMAVACLKMLKINEMIYAFRKVVEIGEPGSFLVEQSLDHLKGFEEQIKKSDGIGLDDYLDAQNIFDRAFGHMPSGNWVDAISDFEKALEINPRHPQSYGNIGMCYASIGKKELALAAIDKAIELDPHYEVALVNRKVVESLEDGEFLPSGRAEVMDYYKEYPLQKRSYIQELASKQHVLAEKDDKL